VKLDRRWMMIGGGGVLCAGLILFGIKSQYENIDTTRAEVAALRGNIEVARKEIDTTRSVERDVIVLREMAGVMREILPDNEDVNNLVRELQRFSELSEVRISGLKKKPADSKDKGDFDKVGYTLQLEGDAFQLLDFLNLIENHARFMRVPSFRITATQRNQLEKDGIPAHKIQMDVETFVYEPRKDGKQARIADYEHKRDLLLGEIQGRKQALSVSGYAYRGPRGRRDPWIDPRVPATTEGQGGYTVQEQMDIVQKLCDRARKVAELWSASKAAENVIEQMLKRSEFDGEYSALGGELARVESERVISYVPSQRRLQSEVRDLLDALASEVSASGAVTGPSETQLLEIEEAMTASMQRGDWKAVLENFKAVEKDLGIAEADPVRGAIVARLRSFEADARTVLEFEKLKLEFGGRAIVRERAFAVINGKTVGVGDAIAKDLLVHAIGRDEIEFLYKGIVFARRY
jgi:Tfp pilus assembly protein PilO